MGIVYVCGRCGEHGHKALDCKAPRRFEGICSTYSQYGDISRFIAVARVSKAAGNHLNVVTRFGEINLDGNQQESVYMRRGGVANAMVHHQQYLGEEGTAGDSQWNCAVQHVPAEQAIDDAPPGDDDCNEQEGWNRGVVQQTQLAQDLPKNGADVIDSSGDISGGNDGTGSGIFGGVRGVGFGGFFSLQLVCSNVLLPLRKRFLNLFRIVDQYP